MGKSLRSRGWFVFSGFVVFFLAGTVTAEAVEKTYKIEPSQSLIQFRVGSTLHEIHGKAKEWSADTVLHNFDTGKTETPAAIRILVDSLDTDNGRRDKAMFKMFEGIKFPAILWEAKEILCSEKTEGNSRHCRMKGFLKIRDFRKELTIPVTLEQRKEDLQVSGSAEVSLVDFDLKPPSVLRVIRVFDTVTVRFSTLWKPAEKL